MRQRYSGEMILAVANQDILDQEFHNIIFAPRQKPGDSDLR